MSTSPSFAVYEGAFTQAEGFPRPDWKRIGEWIQAHVPRSRHFEAWDSAAELWLRKMRAQLGAPYTIDVDGEFALLSPLPLDDATAVLRHAVSAKQSMQAILRRLPTAKPLGSHVMIAFQSNGAYCTYISYYYEEGAYGFAPAMCINEDYVHMVFAPQPLEHLQRSVTHELTHVLLAHLALPSWLEEGLAQILEDLVGGRATFTIDRETAARHKAYWREHGLKAFWSGDSYHQPDDGRELSYGLSQVLVRNLATDHGSRFFDFVAAAKRQDAGESAMRRHLGMGLAECAAQFLGPGDWEPDFDELDAKSRGTGQSEPHPRRSSPPSS